MTFNWRSHRPRSLLSAALENRQLYQAREEIEKFKFFLSLMWQGFEAYFSGLHPFEVRLKLAKTITNRCWRSS
ncbi:MAG: hypothetical protein F6J93_01190 [Oscillatoria sp. SIO1A7]|nr:hypothetical protein [Oscillatoria sp. SIO1A7]